MMAVGALNVEPLISHRFQISEGEAAMQLLASSEPTLGILLNFPNEKNFSQFDRNVPLNRYIQKLDIAEACNAGFLGAGNYAGRILMPAFKAAGASLDTVVSSGGVSSFYFGRKFGFREASTDSDLLFSNDDIDTIVVATRHNAHAEQVLMALDSGKHVFCEKPLCLTIEELEKIRAKSNSLPSKILMVGFNRRFAPQVQKMIALLRPIEKPKSIIITVNSGQIPADHWIQDPAIGGGRMIGEGCHFIDLARYLAGSRILNFQVQSVGGYSGIDVRDDKFTVNLAFEDGSFASINYLANGHTGFPKERVEVFTSGRVLQLDNFRVLRGWGWADFKSSRLWRQNKGQLACVDQFVRAVKGLAPVPIARDEVLEISRFSIEIAEVLRS
jgi:predicted dehydrogenase